MSQDRRLLLILREKVQAIASWYPESEWESGRCSAGEEILEEIDKLLEENPE